MRIFPQIGQIKSTSRWFIRSGEMSFNILLGSGESVASRLPFCFALKDKHIDVPGGVWDDAPRYFAYNSLKAKLTGRAGLDRPHTNSMIVS